MQLPHSDYYIKAHNIFSFGTNCLQGDHKKKIFQNFQYHCMETHIQTSIFDSLHVSLSTVAILILTYDFIPTVWIPFVNKTQVMVKDI